MPAPQVAPLAQPSSLPVTSTVSDDAGHGARWPQFAVHHDSLFVTDPARGLVHVVDLVALEVTGSIAVAGSPAKVVALTPEQ